MEPNFLETLFTVRTTRTYTRFNAREVVVTIDKPITNPITDFMNVIEVLGDGQRYSDSTIVHFNLYDSNNRAVWFSRIDGQPLFLGGLRTRNEQLLLRLFDMSFWSGYTITRRVTRQESFEKIRILTIFERCLEKERSVSFLSLKDQKNHIAASIMRNNDQQKLSQPRSTS